MKKILSLTGLALFAATIFSGCSCQKEQTYLGKYEFDYIRVDDTIYYACPASGEIEISGSSSLTCDVYEDMEIELTNDELKLISGHEIQKTDYIINDENEILVGDDDIYDVIYTAKNNKLYAHSENYIIVFKKAN